MKSSIAVCKINNGYPTPAELISCEINTLQYFRDTTSFCKSFTALYSDSYNFLAKYHDQIKNKSLRAVRFESQIDDIRINTKPGTAHIGVIITQKDSKTYDQLSYYIAISDNSDPEAYYIRKFHFDYTLIDPARKQPHPIFHLQYPGEFSERLRNSNIKHEHLAEWLSEPRLPFSPMSLALLVNLVFKEFPNENTHNVIEDSRWRDLIRKNEKLLLEPYYKNCHNFISQRSPDMLITNDFYYGL
ncbi:MAG: hypothetical protein AB1325_01150 [Nitrospirota bacterium]